MKLMQGNEKSGAGTTGISEIIRKNKSNSAHGEKRRKRRMEAEKIFSESGLQCVRPERKGRYSCQECE